VPVAADARFVAQGLTERLPQADADVLDRVMVVDVQVAAASTRRSNAPCRANRSSMWSRNPTPVRTCERPVPSRFNSSWICVSAVRRSMVAVRFIALHHAFSKARQASICSSVPTLIRRPSPQPG
jgi:hypothetical protein